MLPLSRQLKNLEWEKISRLINNRLTNNRLINNRLTNNRLINDRLINNRLINNRLTNNRLINNRLINNRLINDALKSISRTEYLKLTIKKNRCHDTFDFCDRLLKIIEVKAELNQYVMK